MDAATRRLLIGVQVCFGVFPALGKLAMEAFDPRAVLVWSLFVGAGVLLGIAVLRHGRRAWPGWGDCLRLAGLSLLGVSINQALFLEGLDRSTSVNAGLLMTVIPVATVGLSAWLRAEPLTRPRLIGVTLAVAGVAWLFVGRGAGLGAATLTGDLLMTANALSYSCYLVLARPVLLRQPNLVVVGWIFAWGAVTTPWIALDVTWWPAAAEARHWAALGGVLLLPTILAYLGNAIVLARTHATVTATYVMLQPFVAAALGIAVLGERPGWRVAVTAPCVLGGLWLVSRPPGRVGAR